MAPLVLIRLPRTEQEKGDLDCAGWDPTTFSLPSQGFYKSGKFVFSFKVSPKWAEVAIWTEDAASEVLQGTYPPPFSFPGARWARVTHMIPPR